MNEKETGGGQSGIVTLLSVMMFLQFFAWGTWFATLSAAMGFNDFGDFIGGAYETAPIAAIFAPLFLGLIADRFFPSEKVMGVLMLVGGVIMCFIPSIAAQGPESGGAFVWCLLLYMLCYMPTLGLGNTIAFTHISNQSLFPKIRVWGTIGWIVAGLLVGAMGWSTSFGIFWLGAGSSILLGLFCFALPRTPPPLKGKPVDVRSLLMVDAFKLLKDPNFLVFAICSTLICVPLAYYYGVSGNYLTQTGFAQSAATLTIGQMSEIFFMILIPFFFRKLGVKLMLMVGMGCWVVRYVLFALGAPEQITWMLLLGVALHGICYDFFFVTGFMYTDDKAPSEVRGQAQSLLVFLTQGIGMFFGFRIAFGGSFLGIPLNLSIKDYGKQVDAGAYLDNLKATAGEAPETSFLESFTQMFTRALPEGLDQELLSTTMNQWSNFWMFPAIMAGAVLVIFTIAFWDKMTPADEDESNSGETKPESA